MLIIDSARPHLNEETIKLLRRKSVVVAVIPAGCTVYLQVLDVSIFSVFKRHYTDAAEEFLEHDGRRNNVKLTASESRILCTRLTTTAWRRTIETCNFKEEFRRIGYIWTDDSPVTPRTLPGFVYDPLLTIPDMSMLPDEESRRIETEAKEAHLSSKTSQNEKKKQTTLRDFWKK